MSFSAEREKMIDKATKNVVTSFVHNLGFVTTFAGGCDGWGTRVSLYDAATEEYSNIGGVAGYETPGSSFKAAIAVGSEYYLMGAGLSDGAALDIADRDGKTIEYGTGIDGEDDEDFDDDDEDDDDEDDEDFDSLCDACRSEYEDEDED